MPAIASHTSSTTDAPWNAGTNERRIKTPIVQADASHFWAWREAGDWPTTKTGYRFPHHMVSDGGQPGGANVTACSSVIATLNGARGGTDIPAGDKQGVYDHVARHLKAAGKTPPPLGASAEDSERWAADIEAEEAHLMTDEAREAGHHDTDAGGGLPPLLPLGRKGWAIRDGLLPELLRAARDAQANLGSTRAMAAAVPQATPSRLAANGQRSAGAVAVIPLCGIISPRGSLLSMLFGGGRGGLASFRDDFADAITSPEIGAVVLDVDSPGGLVDLVPETAAMIRAARGQGKPIKAVVNTTACSAAYWLAAQADEIVASPSSELGSIGVYMLHLDYSGMNERLGVDPTYVKVPPAKTEGNPDEPLSEDAQATWQRDVEDLYAMFVADVAAGRNVSADAVRANYGEGRSLPAQRALEAGLCDRVGTLEQVVGELLGAPAGAEDPDVVTAEARLTSAAAALEAAASRIADALGGRAAADDDEEDEDEESPEDEPADEGDPDDDDDEDEDELPPGEPTAPAADDQDEAAQSASLLFDRQVFAP